MPAVLYEGLRISDADLASAFGAEAFHRFNVLVDAVVRPQPFALRRMANQHADFAIELFAYIDVSRRLDELARVRVAAFDRITIV